MKKVGFVIFVGAVGLMVLASLAGAATKTRKVTTKVTVSVSGQSFNGKVKSKKATCRKGRKVIVFKARNRVGTARSDAGGRWSLSPGGTLAAGNYYAKATKKRHKRILCRKARSDKVKVSGGGGGGHTYDTTLTINYASTGPYTASFTGAVSSPGSACVSGREVTVFRQASGGDVQIAHAMSNGSGNWTIALGGAPPAGNYYSSTPRTTPDASTTCQAGTSPAKAVP